VMFDPDAKGITLSSLNPNLRVIGHVVQKTEVNQGAGGVMSATALGFLVKLGASFVQAVEYNGRWFVRDGYHRCYGLLANGITRIPCMLIHAVNFAQTGAEQPGFFSYEILFGDRPPPPWISRTMLSQSSLNNAQRGRSCGY